MKHFQRIYPLTVVLLFIILNILGIRSLMGLQTQSSLEQFQPKNHPILTADNAIRSRFQMDRSQLPLVLLLESKQGSWLKSDMVEELDSLGRHFKKSDEVSYALSLSNMDVPINEEHSFTLAPMKELLLRPDAENLILNNPLLTPHFVSKDGKYAAMLIKTNGLSFKQQAEFIEKVEKKIAEKSSFYSGEVAGPSAISAQMTSLLEKEIVLFSSLSLLISILAIFIIFNSWSAALMSLMTVISANVITLGLMSAFGINLTVLSSTTPILVTLTVIAVLSQTLSRMGELPQHMTRWQQIFLVLKELSITHLLATSATAIGFATLISSEIPIIKDYGWVVAVSVLIASVVTMALFSALYMWLPIPKTRCWPWNSRQVAYGIFKHNKPLVIGITSFCIVMAALSSQLNWSALLFDDLPENHQARLATRLVEENLGGVIPLEVSLTSESAAPWESPAQLRALSDLTDRWRKIPEVGSVIALSDFLKLSNAERQIASLPQSISETLFVYSMAQKNPIEHFLSPNGKSTRLALRLRDIPSAQMDALVQKLKKDAVSTFPDMQVETAGLAATAHPIHESLAKELIFGFYVALLWIVGILFFVFGRMAIIAALPNLVPPALLVGALALTQTPIKPGVAIIFSISLGIAFNNTTYILRKIQSHLRKYKKLSVYRLMREELGPCFLTSCAVMSGFAVFLLSSFAMNRIFGTFMIISVIAGLLGDLVLFPAFLALFPQVLPRQLSNERLFSTARLRKMPVFQKFTAGLFIFALTLFAAQKAQATPTVEEIIKKLQSANTTPSEMAEIHMKIEEPDGTIKERSMVIKKKTGKEQKAMVKLTSPTNLKGIALLTIIDEKKEQSQWLYLPSEKRSRRIVGSNKKGRFLDSELNFEDMSLDTYKNFNNKVSETDEKGKKHLLIESIAKDKSESSYSKILTWLEPKSYRVIKSDYFDEDGKLIKQISFSDFKKFGGKAIRPKLMSIKNVQKNRSTILELKKLSIKKIDDNDFSMSALEEG